MPVRVFDQVDGEPDSTTVAAALATYRQQPAAMVVGIGGGSALDAAKAMAVLVDDPSATIESMAASQAPWRRNVGLACVPTTAGTGSEVTDVAVIMGPDHRVKHLIKGLALMPDVAALDGNLMLGLPPGVTAATGIDALTHAIEAFVSREINPLSKPLAYGAVKDIALSLRRAVGNGTDGPARCDMAIAAYNAGLAFGNAGLGLVHAMSHVIGARYEIPHGVANALLLTEVMRFNRLVCEEAYAELGIALGVATERLTQRERSLAAIEAVECLLQDIGVYHSLREFRAQAEDFPLLAPQVLEDVCCASNPRQVCVVDVIRIYQTVLER
jgi:alcohol dehydrogenase